jgi:GNAT superfamily N-acetyltransferase
MTRHPHEPASGALSSTPGVEHLTVEYLAEHRDLVPLIARWHWRHHGGAGRLDFWIQAHDEEAQGRDVPTAWVAFLSGQPVGCVSLIRCNMDTYPDLTPWLAALFVIPEMRGGGVGTALTRHCEQSAAALGYATLYLYTETAAAFYGRLGWQVRSVEEYEGEQVVVMKKRIRS